MLRGAKKHIHPILYLPMQVIGIKRRGLGIALQLHGMLLARAAGAKRMLVACRGIASAIIEDVTDATRVAVLPE
ncbi:hypothetical protein [Mesorhizobium dulcispinae]|uniref:hypothetical protein n=1 Tax=Mesorhizobium dulcispinae TaxID=3072316 RepID=UPI002A24DCDC|nr:hypothetical protein [Mesorhizobium sp. VK23D]MDX8517485.1 hypothetical protein [Mesorhizobium sp. VK23D]